MEHLYSTDEPFPEREAASIVLALRRSRLFEAAEKIADALIICGSDTPRLRRLHAQVLLDLGKLSTVLIYLEDLGRLSEGVAPENRETRGLMGRAYKQLYLLLNPQTKGARIALSKAIDCYRILADEEPTRAWFSINVVALLCRAMRDGVAVASVASPLEEPTAIALRVLEQVKEEERIYDGPPPFWDCAIASEACLALGRFEEALTWLIRYAVSPEVDAFDLESDSRQLTEVWDLKMDSEPGTSLLAILWGALLLRRGSALTIRPHELTPGPLLQQLVGQNRQAIPEVSVIADYLFTAKARAESVVTVAGPGRRAYGTGMLLRGADLHERFGPGLVLLTSYRVLSGDPAVVEALRPEEAVLMAASSEETPDKLLELDIAKILWSSPPHELGVTVAEVRGDVESLSPLRMTDGVAPGQRAETLYLVGQLATLELSITIQQNLLLHDNGGQLHYRSFGDELLPGASLFDAQWQLIGVHVSANLPCNFCRGISSAGATIQAIKEALGKDFSDVGEVFLCYARKDQVFVMQLAEALHRMRVRIWLDQWSIPDGSNWDAEIDKALERCSRMLIVLSPQAVASEEVRSELRVALDERKPVVPIVHQTCRLPRQLRRTQFIDLTGRDELGEEAISRVLEALRAGTVSEPEV